jgi:ORF6N domain
MEDNNKLQLFQDHIFTIRGLQVMFDKDLAGFYNVKPIRLREQVKRNHKRFPSDFMFRLTEEEVEVMVSQNAIPSRQQLGGSLPYVFTEQGVTSLSAVLTSDRAIEINIQIARAFIEMRRFLSLHAGVFQRLDNVEQKLVKSDENFNKIFRALEDKSIKPKQDVFFNGQIYDAYQVILIPWMGSKVVNTLTFLLKHYGYDAESYCGIIDVKNANRSEICKLLKGLKKGNTPSNTELAMLINDKQIEKYDHLLPEELLNIESGARTFDVDGALEWIRSTTL